MAQERTSLDIDKTTDELLKIVSDIFGLGISEMIITMSKVSRYKEERIHNSITIEAHEKLMNIIRDYNTRNNKLKSIIEIKSDVIRILISTYIVNLYDLFRASSINDPTKVVVSIDEYRDLIALKKEIKRKK